MKAAILKLLICLTAPSLLCAQALELIVVNPTHEIDYSSPRRLLISLALAERLKGAGTGGGSKNGLREMSDSTEGLKTEDGETLPAWLTAERLQKLLEDSLSDHPTRILQQVQAGVISLRNRGPFYHVGHTMVRLVGPKNAPGELGQYRSDPMGYDIHFQSASTDQDPAEQSQLIFQDKVGFAFAFLGTKGRLQARSEIASAVGQLIPSEHPFAWVRIELSPENFERVKTYVAELQKRRVHEKFGLNFEPRRAEGMGCSSFGITCLEVSGALDPYEAEKLKLGLRVPLSLMGDPTKGIKVDPFWDGIVSARASRWALPEEPHRELLFRPVDTFYSWIASRVRAPESALPANYRTPHIRADHPWIQAICAKGVKKALLIDARNAPVVTDPIFK